MKIGRDVRFGFVLSFAAIVVSVVLVSACESREDCVAKCTEKYNAVLAAQEKQLIDEKELVNKNCATEKQKLDEVLEKLDKLSEAIKEEQLKGYQRVSLSLQTNDLKGAEKGQNHARAAAAAGVEMMGPLVKEGEALEKAYEECAEKQKKPIPELPDCDAECPL